DLCVGGFAYCCRGALLVVAAFWLVRLHLFAPVRHFRRQGRVLCRLGWRRGLFGRSVRVRRIRRQFARGHHHRAARSRRVGQVGLVGVVELCLGAAVVR